MIIYLIVGLPGSGKTTLLNKFKRCYKIDDIKDLSELPDTNKSVKRLVIADPNFCFPNVLKNAENILMEKYSHAKILKIFFENDSKKAIFNANKRENKKVTYFINLLSDEYQIPKGYRSLKIKCEKENE